MPILGRPSSPRVTTCEGSGSITAPILVSRKPRYGIEVIGPGRFDVKWQANTEQGIDASICQSVCAARGDRSYDFEGECVPLACAAPVLSVLLKRICSILVLPPRSMSCVRWLGSMEMNALPHASPLSSGCTMQLKKVSQQ